MKRLAVFTLISLLIISSIFLYLKSVSRRATFNSMGTLTTISVEDNGAPSHIRSAISRIKEIEKLLNRYAPKSEVSRLNRGEKFILSDDTKNCIQLAEKAKTLTSGAFDPNYLGSVNLDGIAKGYAIEEARRLLFKRGVKSAIIDMRSSIAVLGGPYKIGIKHPREENEILEVVTLHDGESLSTSGDYEQSQHIIDPKTKKPATLCQSVTVIMKDAGMADALSTGMFVLGPAKSIALANKLGIKVLIVSSVGKVFSN